MAFKKDVETFRAEINGIISEASEVANFISIYIIRLSAFIME